MAPPKKYALGPAASALHPQHLRFVEEYLAGGTGDGAIKRAAIRAGYAIDGASCQGSRLLTKPHIQKAITELKQASADRIGITQDRILQELAQIAFSSSDHTITVDEEGNESVDISSPNEAVVTTTGGKNKSKVVTLKSVKVADRITALEKMGKHLGMFTEKVEVSAAVSLLDLVTKSFIQPKPIQIEEQPVYKIISEEYPPGHTDVNSPTEYVTD